MNNPYGRPAPAMAIYRAAALGPPITTSVGRERGYASGLLPLQGEAAYHRLSIRYVKSWVQERNEAVDQHATDCHPCELRRLTDRNRGVFSVEISMSPPDDSLTVRPGSLPPTGLALGHLSPR